MKPIRKQSAFTLAELVFVIVVIGILASVAIPRLKRDVRQEAADNIVNAIRYTKLMALNDNKMPKLSQTAGNDNWQKRLWSIYFVQATNVENTYYYIGTDANSNGAISKNEAGVDPSNGKYFYNSSGYFASRSSDESPDIFIGHNYGINSISFQGGCSNNRKNIGFDHLGRPYNGVTGATYDYGRLLGSDCNLTFSFTDTNIPDLQITIEKQTGHVCVWRSDGSCR